MSNNLVSLLIPTYITNAIGMKHLKSCLTSIAAQTCGPDEIVICDDSTHDYVEDLLQGIHFPKSQRIVYIKNRKRLGIAENYNACIENASSIFVHLFAQDESFISVQSYSNVRENLLNSKESSWFFVEGLNQFKQSGQVEINERLLLGINELGGLSSLLFPRNANVKLDTNLVQFLDTDLIYRISRTHGKPRYVPGPNFKFGYGNHQTTAQVSSSCQEIELRYLIQKHRISTARICDVLNQFGPREHKKIIARAIKGS